MRLLARIQLFYIPTPATVGGIPVIVFFSSNALSSRSYQLLDDWFSSCRVTLSNERNSEQDNYYGNHSDVEANPHRK